MKADLLLQTARKVKSPDKRRVYMVRWREAKLREDIQACTACPLHETRTQAVPFTGKPGAIALIGEAPGYHEDRTGEPFVGKAGRLLDRSLEQAQLSRDDVFLFNTICCRPTGNDYEEAIQLGAPEACKPLFEKQLAMSRALVIILAGNRAMDAVLGQTGITRYHGKPIWAKGHTWLPVKHPAWYLRNLNSLEEFISDLRVVKRLVDGRLDLPIPKAKTWGQFEHRDIDIKEMMKGTQWVHLFSESLQDQVVVVRDEDVNVPSRLQETTTYTLNELARIGVLGDGPRETVEMLQAIHLVKGLGGKVIA